MEKLIKEKMRKIQKKFDFVIPDYLLEVLPKADRYEVRAFIGLALVNNRITEEQANILICEYCNKDKEKSKILEMSN